jgi:D-alanyl-D-alanine carboxypeptidase
LAWQGHRGYKHQRDTRLPTVVLVFSCGVLAWVLVGPRSLATRAPAITPTPVAVVTSTPRSSLTPEPLPACGIGDIPTWHQKYSDWQLTLLDTTYGLDSTYAPPDLVPVTEAGFTGDGEVRALVIGDLGQMREAAAANGVHLTINADYRSYADQAATYQQLKASKGTTAADLAAAQPGHSEHQLGTAIDFGSGYDWLLANAWSYGFILSFPQDSSPAFTCYKAVPWQYRYFGRDTAAAIHNSGMTTRRWLWQNAPPPRGYAPSPRAGTSPSPRAGTSPSPAPSRSGLVSPSPA